MEVERSDVQISVSLDSGLIDEITDILGMDKPVNDDLKQIINMNEEARTSYDIPKDGHLSEVVKRNQISSIK